MGLFLIGMMIKVLLLNLPRRGSFGIVLHKSQTMEKVVSKTKTTTKVAETKSTTKFSKETYIKWYESMLLMRKFEEKTGQLYIQQKIRGFCHLYIGQEALVAGSESVLRREDRVITAYRDHAHPIGRGLHPKYIMAEMMAKATGCSKGKGGSMHIFSKEFNFFGGHGIVGGQIPLGAGIAFTLPGNYQIGFF